MEVYKHSGSVPMSGALTTFTTGAVAAAVLGVVYALGIHYIPFIYLNFLLTVCFGAAIGAVVGWASRKGRIRNLLVVGALAVASGLVGLYLAWAGALAVLTRFNFGFVIDPLVLANFMAWLYENGSWGLRNGGPVTGIPLVLVWLVEAGLVLAIAWAVARGMIAGKAYCERCDQWTELEEGVQRLLVRSEDERPLQEVLQGNLAGLREMLRAPEGSNAYLQLDLATCPACPASNFLTIQAIRNEIDKKGNTQTVKQALVANMLIAEQDIDLVRNAGQPTPATPEPPPVDTAAAPESSTESPFV